MSEHLLFTHGLKKVYDGRAVVNGVEINVRHGEIVEEGDRLQVITAPAHDYTRELIDSLPQAHMDDFDGSEAAW